MPLRKSPQLTPALLAANRGNARNSTGPRTAAGKLWSALNSLKHGRTSKAFRHNLSGAGDEVELYDWIHAQIRNCFEPLSPPEQMQAERLAREVWCRARRALRQVRLKTKPECPLESIDRPRRFPSRIRIYDHRGGRRLSFWVPRRRGTVPPRIPLIAFPEVAAWLQGR